MKQGPARKAFSLWFIAGLLRNQFFSDANVDHSKVPSADRGESWLSEPMTYVSQRPSEIQFFHQSSSKVGQFLECCLMMGICNKDQTMLVYIDMGECKNETFYFRWELENKEIHEEV